MQSYHTTPDAAPPPGTLWKANGRLAAEHLDDSSRIAAVCLHLSPALFILLGFLFPIVPLVLWLAMRDRSVFMNDHGREHLNFLISFVLLHVLLTITIIGIALLPVLWIVGVIGIIRGAIAAGQNEYYRYPATIRLLS